MAAERVFVIVTELRLSVAISPGFLPLTSHGSRFPCPRNIAIRWLSTVVNVILTQLHVSLHPFAAIMDLTAFVLATRAGGAISHGDHFQAQAPSSYHSWFNRRNSGNFKGTSYSMSALVYSLNAMRRCSARNALASRWPWLSG